MKQYCALWQPLMNVVWPHTRTPPSFCRSARGGVLPGPPPPHMITPGLSTYTSLASSGSMPPAAIALISEPSITFQATDASMAAIASRMAMVSSALASSPPSSGGSVKRKKPVSTSRATRSSGSRRMRCASSAPASISPRSSSMICRRVVSARAFIVGFLESAAPDALVDDAEHLRQLDARRRDPDRQRSSGRWGRRGRTRAGRSR